MFEELIDVLDENGNKTGQIKTKSQIKKEGNFHRAISVCIINSNKEILMQKRSNTKKVYPNLWSCFVKGHVMSGETTINACIREIEEELGIHIFCKDIKYLYTIKEEKITDGNYNENIFYDRYILVKDIELKDLKIQKEEIADVKYMYYKDVEKLFFNCNTEIVPNIEDYKKIFDIISKI